MKKIKWRIRDWRDRKIRKHAALCAATYCNGGGWGGAEAVVDQAKIFEEYLRGDR